MEIYYWIPFFYQIDIKFKVFFFGLTKTSLTNWEDLRISKFEIFRVINLLLSSW